MIDMPGAPDRKTAMTRMFLTFFALALATATPALAQGNSGNARGCPPGLAKKNPPCIPPGQAKKGNFTVGDRFDGDVILVDRRRFDLPPLRDGEGYVRVGDSILRLDREERIILDIVTLILN